jgi:predicted acylesterase/phospholipase RssA
VDPVPVASARALFPKLPVVAVVLNEPAGTVPPSMTLPAPEGWAPALLERVSRTRYMKALDIFMRSMDMINCSIAEYRLAIDKPEVIIRPPVTDIELLGKVNVHSVVLRGEVAADAALPAIQNLFTWQYQMQKRFGWK